MSLGLDFLNGQKRTKRTIVWMREELSKGIDIWNLLRLMEEVVDKNIEKEMNDMGKELEKELKSKKGSK